MPMVIHESDRPEFRELEHHCSQCSTARGRLHRVRCGIEAFKSFAAPRLITMLVAVGVLVLIGLSLPLHA